MTIELGTEISDIVKYQLPENLQTPENSQFVALLKHYYDWLTAEGQPTDFIHNILKYRDIDLTNVEFRQHLTVSLIDAIPVYSKADRTLLTKHVTTFLKAKGSLDSFKFIMNAIYGEDIEMKWNANKLFRASANEYSRTASLVIESVAPFVKVEGSEIVQTLPTPASAIIENCTTTSFGGTYLNWLTLNDRSVFGTFSPESEIEALHNDIDRNWTRITFYYDPIKYANHQIEFYATAEELRPYDGLILKQLNSTFRAVVSSFVSRYQETGRTRLVLKITTETGTYVPGNQIYLIPSVLESKIYIDTDFETGIVSKSILDVNIQNGGSLYTQGDRVTFVGGSGELVDGYIGETTKGGVDNIRTIRKGYGYSVGDTLRAINEDTGGAGVAARVSSIDGIDGAISAVSELNSLSIADSGSGYIVNDEIELIGGVLVDGTPPARARVSTVASAWLFKGIEVTAPGSGYAAYTKIALINTATTLKVAGFVAAPVFDQTGGILSVSVTNIPAISVATLAIAANGYGATATANLVANAVSTISMVNVGVNYVDPIARIVGDGTGAILSPVMTGDTVTGITVVKGGTGYTSATVVISERYGSGFTAIPLIQNQTAGSGSITGLTILTRGKYKELPECFDMVPVTKIGSGRGAKLSIDFRLLSVSLDDIGHYYHAVDTSVSGKGVGASLLPSIRNGVITAFRQLVGGTGYTYAHIFVNGGSGAVATATISGGVITGIVAVNGGSGYAAANTVTIIGDGINASFDLNGAGNVNDGILDVTVLEGGHNYFYGTTIASPVAAGVAAVLTPLIVDGTIKSVSSTGGNGYVDADLANISINSGTQSTLTTTISGTGAVLGSTRMNGGIGYKSQSEVTPISISTGVAGTGAVFLPTIGTAGKIVRVDVLDGGSGYTVSSTVSITNGGGTGAVLKLVTYSGRVTDVIVVDGGIGYSYGTSVIVIGDGIGAVLTPMVETGITSAEMISAGTNYASTTTVIVTDPTGTGAEIRPIIVDGAITSLDIINKGTGYTAPVLTFGTPGAGTGATTSVKADRFISSLTVTTPGSGYTHADALIIGDGNEANFELLFEKFGSIDATAILNAGTGLTSTPMVTVTDGSAYGAVSGVTITNNGAGYGYSPILVLDNKTDILGDITATGTKFTCYGTNIGSIRKVLFDNHGAFYNDAPRPIFTLNAVLTENAAFTVGETVRLKSGKYRDLTSTNSILLESGDRISSESGTDIVVTDRISSFSDIDVEAVVLNFDFDRNTIKLNSASDAFFFMSEDDKLIQSEDEIDIVDEQSNTFDVGDQLVGLKSGGRATIEFLNRANGSAVRGGNGWSEFKFTNDSGMLNNSQSVLANNQKYQDYSYVIKAGIALKEYERLLKDTVHPAGFSMYGEVILQNQEALGILEEIGYNKLVSIVYILSLVADYQSGSEWSEMKELFGDFTKFNNLYLPISLVQDYTIMQTSDVIFRNYNEYYTLGSPYPSSLLDHDLANWLIENSAHITPGTFIGPDGSYGMTRVNDTSSIAVSMIDELIACTIGDTITLEAFVKKQTGQSNYASIKLSDTANDFDELRINLETGAYVKIGASTFDLFDMGDYWFARIRRVSTTIQLEAHIHPAPGFVSDINNENITATGFIEVSGVVAKNITGLDSHVSMVKAINSQYVPDKFYLLNTESDIVQV